MVRVAEQTVGTRLGTTAGCLGRTFGLWRVGLADRALRVDTRSRVDGLMADGASVAWRERQVVMLGIHQVALDS